MDKTMEARKQSLMRGVSVRITDIQWDTDGEDPEAFGLPGEAVIEGVDPNEDVDAAEWLSDRYGFLVRSFKLS